jgi:lysozyme
MSLNGKDYSEWQKVIDWDAELADGVQFALIRASYGITGVDSQFSRNQSEVRRVGIPHGFYHYADTSGDPTTQATHFVLTVGPLQVGECLSLDQEEVNLGDAFWDAFLVWVSNNVGFPPLGYASSSYYLTHGLDNPDNSGDWVANWNSKMPNPPPGWQFIAIWQNSDTGTSKVVGGGTVTCDTDVFNGTVSQFLAYGKPGTPTPPPVIQPAPAPVTPPPAPSPPPAPVVSPVPVPPPLAQHEQTVVTGDTLSEIAAENNESLAVIEEENPQITNPNLIYPGEQVEIGGAAPSPTPSHQTTLINGHGSLSGTLAWLNSAAGGSHNYTLSQLENANPQLQRGANQWRLVYSTDDVILP